MDHAGRRARLQAWIADQHHHVDAVVVSASHNVRYLSGFTGSNGALLVPVDEADDVLLCTDSRYVTQAALEADDVALLVQRSCVAALLEQAAGRGLRRVGLEGQHVSWSDVRSWRRSSPGVELVAFDGAVEAQREVKDAAELDLIAQACAITSATFEQVADGLSWVGRTERHIAAELEDRMRRLGAEGPAFDTIVGAGPHSAIPHHRPGERVLADGDLVVVDFGARVGGYHADMTRTIVLGRAASWQADLAALVLDAQTAARATLAVGVELAAIDAAARDLITAAGHGGQFGHGTGHGIGLEIHEAPQVAPGAAGRLAAAVPVTVEPGVYLPGRGGVRIEDTLVVTDDGPASLTTTSREFRALR